MRILIFGEIFSENLGDGVIAETLAFIVQKGYPQVTVEFVDMSGRSGYPGNSDPHGVHSELGHLKARLFNLSKTPTVRRALRAINWQLRNRKRFLDIYDEALRDVSCLIIGGGQLLMDNNLSFPLKISQMIHCARARAIPVHVASVGVGEYWSPYARRLFVPALRSVDSISVRDEMSAARLAARGIRKITRSCDPALFASDCYGPPAPGLRHGTTIGLGVMAPASFHRYTSKAAKWEEKDLAGFWMELCRSLHAQKLPFALFTNGSRDDHAFAAGVARQLADTLRCHSGLLLPRPTTPAQLAQSIAGFGCTISFRMHASIIAASYGIPPIGISWDDKVDWFFKGVGMPSQCMSIDRNTVAEISSRARQLVGQGPTYGKIPALKAQMEQGMAEMLRNIAARRREL